MFSRDQIVHAMQNPNPAYCISTLSLKRVKLSTGEPNQDLESCENVANSLCYRTGTETLCLHVRDFLSLVTNPNQNYANITHCDKDEAFVTHVFGTNHTKFVQVRREDEKDFLFVGNPALIYSSIQVSEYCPKYRFAPLSLPNMMEKMCNYIISFSGALAILNVVPSVLLDGQHMMQVLLGRNILRTGLNHGKIISNK